MNSLSKEQLADTMTTIRGFKQLIREKGSKQETIQYLMQETGLPKEECETAFDFYDGIQLP